MENWRKFVNEQSDIDTSLQDRSVNWLERLIRAFAEYRPYKSREYKSDHEKDEEITRAANDIAHPDRRRREFAILKNIIRLIDKLIVKNRRSQSGSELKLQNRPNERSPIEDTTLDLNMWKKLFNNTDNILEKPYPTEDLLRLQMEPNARRRLEGYRQISQTLEAKLKPLKETE
tara:strand:- start:1185 stop:1706 length:522 start_codon:yes stop_codon:yes gene_type:complete